MICFVETIHKEKVGYVSELFFCKKYDIDPARFARWIMTTPCKIYAGFNVFYNEAELVLNLPKM